MSGIPSSSVPVPHVWRPSAARRVVVDGFLPLPRGGVPAMPEPLVWPAKDPGDVLDYEVDIAEALAGNDGDEIVTVAVTFDPPGELSAGVTAADGSRAIVWLSGGVADTTYVVQVTIATASGRTIGRAVLLPVQSLATATPAAVALTTLAGSVVRDQLGNPILVSD